MEELKIEKKKAILAYYQATDDCKKLLTDLFGKEVFISKITDKVKTFEDACLFAGHSYEKEFCGDAVIGMSDNEIAYRMIKVIAKALNEGVVLDFTNATQYKFYPYFKFGWASGSGLSLVGVAYGVAAAIVAPHLCFKSEELAEYAAEQFSSVYERYYSTK